MYASSKNSKPEVCVFKNHGHWFLRKNPRNVERAKQEDKVVKQGSCHNIQRVYFFIAGQVTQVAWPIWTAFAGQLWQAGQLVSLKGEQKWTASVRVCMENKWKNVLIFRN